LFDKNAEEAVRFYISIFKNSKINTTTKYGKEGYEIHHMDEGAIMTIDYELEGQRFIALNGGPIFRFNEAISFQVMCDSQEELDYYWEKLSDGGDEKAQQCGWLKDKYGVSWQIIPKVLVDMLHDKDTIRSQKVIKSMLPMKKIDIKKLQQAYNDKERI
jgi:predicted 3-demethylubiquinone-9 3-methyltransferase (glyoxalase superfamily)